MGWFPKSPATLKHSLAFVGARDTPGLALESHMVVIAAVAV
jgi:hypothetical protein